MKDEESFPAQRRSCPHLLYLYLHMKLGSLACFPGNELHPLSGPEVHGGWVGVGRGAERSLAAAWVDHCRIERRSPRGRARSVLEGVELCGLCQSLPPPSHHLQLPPLFTWWADVSCLVLGEPRRLALLWHHSLLLRAVHVVFVMAAWKKKEMARDVMIRDI